MSNYRVVGVFDNCHRIILKKGNAWFGWHPHLAGAKHKDGIDVDGYVPMDELDAVRFINELAANPDWRPWPLARGCTPEQIAKIKREIKEQQQ